MKFLLKLFWQVTCIKTKKKRWFLIVRCLIYINHANSFSISINLSIQQFISFHKDLKKKLNIFLKRRSFYSIIIVFNSKILNVIYETILLKVFFLLWKHINIVSRFRVYSVDWNRWWIWSSSLYIHTFI